MQCQLEANSVASGNSAPAWPTDLSLGWFRRVIPPSGSTIQRQNDVTFLASGNANTQVLASLEFEMELSKQICGGAGNCRFPSCQNYGQRLRLALCRAVKDSSNQVHPGSVFSRRQTKVNDQLIGLVKELPGGSEQKADPRADGRELERHS
jgi:hypothetical protein